MNFFFKLIFISITSMALSTGCTHSLHNYHVSDSEPIPAESKNTKIEVNTEQFAVFWFVFDTDYVQNAYDQLLAKCPDGKIQGIHTRFSTSLSFLSYTNKIYMQAHCVQ